MLFGPPRAHHNIPSHALHIINGLSAQAGGGARVDIHAIPARIVNMSPFGDDMGMFRAGGYGSTFWEESGGGRIKRETVTGLPQSRFWEGVREPQLGYEP